MGLLKMLADAFRPEPRALGLGRNDLCWCGSGKKYKRCHLDDDRLKNPAPLKKCASA